MPYYVAMEHPNAYVICANSQDHVPASWDMDCVFQWRVLHIGFWVEKKIGRRGGWGWRIERVVSSIACATGEGVAGENVEIVPMLESPD